MFGLSEGVSLAIIAAFTGGVGALFKWIFSAKDSQIKRLEDEVAAGRLKIEELQKAQLEALKSALAAEQNRALSDNRIATGLQGLVDSIKELKRAAQ